MRTKEQIQAEIERLKKEAEGAPSEAYKELDLDAISVDVKELVKKHGIKTFILYARPENGNPILTATCSRKDLAVCGRQLAKRLMKAELERGGVHAELKELLEELASEIAKV